MSAKSLPSSQVPTCTQKILEKESECTNKCTMQCYLQSFAFGPVNKESFYRVLPPIWKRRKGSIIRMLEKVYIYIYIYIYISIDKESSPFILKGKVNDALRVQVYEQK